MTSSASGTGAEGVRFDLSQLVPDAASARQLLDAAVLAAGALEARYAGRVAVLDAAELQSLLDRRGRVEDITRLFGEDGYTLLRRSVDADDTEAADLDGYAESRLTTIADAGRFLAEEWCALDEAERSVRAGRLAAPARRYLDRIGRHAAGRLEPVAERALVARERAASRAWGDLQRDVLAAARGVAAGAERTIPALRALTRDADRDVRIAASDALAAASGACRQVVAACYDAVVGDRLAVDRLRGHDDPLTYALADDDLDRVVVEAAIRAVEQRVDVARGWFLAKGRLLGLVRPTTADLAARVAGPLHLDEARALLVAGFAAVDAGFGVDVDAVFAERRLDAEPRPGKDGGVFCAHPSSDRPGFVFYNFAGDGRGLFDLAHELGHAVAFGRGARAQGPLAFLPGLALCEVPSTFGELAVLESVGDRRDLVVAWLDGCVELVWWAAAMFRFEQDLCAARAGGEALTPERLDARWRARLDALYGDDVEIRRDAELEWVVASHITGARFYNYAYVLAYLVSFCLLGVWRADRAGFAARYVAFVALGDAASPRDQLLALGVDIAEPTTWQRGLDELERLVAAASDGLAS